MIVHTICEAANGPGEDRAIYYDRSTSETVVLADGAGGIGGGGEAAEMVVGAFDRWSTSDPSVAALVELDRALAQEETCGETTCVAFRHQDGKIIGASVGDSAGYVLFDNGIVELTENQYQKPLLGSGSAIPVGFSHAVSAGRVLVCSDGLWKYASYQSMIETAKMRDASEVPQRLIDMVRLTSGGLQDDVSIVLCEL